MRPISGFSDCAARSLAHKRCARSAARRFTRIWATWIAESLAEGFRPRLLRVRLALAPETPSLLAVPAGGHGAPAARVILRAVVVGPATRLRSAKLEPPPALVFHRRVHRRDDAANRGHDAGRLGLQLWPAIRAEAHPQAARGSS